MTKRRKIDFRTLAEMAGNPAKNPYGRPWRHDSSCSTPRAVPEDEFESLPGSRLGVCDSCGALLPMTSLGDIKQQVVQKTYAGITYWTRYADALHYSKTLGEPTCLVHLSRGWAIQRIRENPRPYWNLIKGEWE